MGPLPALHRMDRRQRHPFGIGRRAELVGQPAGEQGGVGLEVGQLDEGVEVVAVGGDGAVAPLVEGFGAGVEAAVAHARPHHLQHVGGGPPVGGLAHDGHVARQVPHLARLPGAALAVQPAGQAGDGVDRPLLGHQVEQRRAHPPLRPARGLPQHLTRQRPVGGGGHRQPRQRGPHPAAVEEAALGHVHRHPGVAQQHLHRRQRGVDPGQHGHVARRRPRVDAAPAPARPSSWPGGRRRRGSTRRPGSRRRPATTGSPWRPARRCGSAGSTPRSPPAPGSGS